MSAPVFKAEARKPMEGGRAVGPTETRFTITLLLLLLLLFTGAVDELLLLLTLTLLLLRWFC